MATESENRRMPRVMRDYGIFVRDGKSVLKATSRDLSLYGIGFYLDRGLAVGSEVGISIFIMEENLNFEVKAVVRQCTALQGEQAKAGKYLIGAEFTEGHENAFPFLESADQQGKYAVNQTMVIDADIQTCYRMVSNIERFPAWNPEIKITRVIERYPDRRCKRVEFEHNLLLIKVRYIDEYTYNDDKLAMNWKNVGGGSELVSNVGGYTLQSLGPRKTAVTFHANITISFIPSQRLINYFSVIGVRRALKSLKAIIEKELSQ